MGNGTIAAETPGAKEQDDAITGEKEYEDKAGLGDSAAGAGLEAEEQVDATDLSSGPFSDPFAEAPAKEGAPEEGGSDVCVPDARPCRRPPD